VRSRTVIAITAIFISISPVQGHASYLFPDEVFQNPQAETYSLTLTDGRLNNNFISRLQGVDPPDPKTGKGGGNYICQNFDDSTCQNLTGISGSLIVPSCAFHASDYCIKGLQISTGTGTAPREMTPIYELDTQKFSASAKNKVPGGYGVTLWRDSQLGDFLVNMNLNFFKPKNMPAEFVSLSTVIAPVDVENNPAYTAIETVKYDAKVGEIPNIMDRTRRAMTIDQAKCLVVEEGRCFIRREFVENTRLTLGALVPSEMKGWLSGRMKDTDVTLIPSSATNSLLSISGTVAKTPNLIVQMPKEQVLKTQSFVDYTKRTGYNNGDDVFAQISRPGPVGSSGSLVDGFWAVESWGDALKAYSGPDKLFGLSTHWNFASITTRNLDSRCTNIKNKFLGIVTTNAPIYESEPPAFKNGFLQYRVAGPHFDTDQKSLFKGVYDLNINSEFARCLYGFTNAPISATISVTNSDGNNQDISTEVMSEKNGWIHLGAYNFHFSSPTVKVKFSQEKSQAPAAQPTPSATPSAKPAPISKISCSKGKVIKRITGSKCPVGYKKVV
jgi:hypothetical protein